MTVEAPPEPVATQQLPKKKRKGFLFWFGALFCTGLILLLALIGLGFYLTTDSGMHRVVLPKLSQAFQQEVRAGSVHWRIWSSLAVEDLKIGPESNPMFEARVVALVYRPWDLLRGRLSFESLSCSQGVIHIQSQEKESGSGLANFLDLLKPGVSTPARASPSEWFPRLSLSQLHIRDLSVFYSAPHEVVSLRKVEVSGSNFKAGAQGIWNMSGEFSIRDSLGGHEHSMEGKWQSQLTTQIDPHWFPKTAQGHVTISEIHTTRDDNPWNGISMELRVDLSTDAQGQRALKEGSLIFQRNGESLGMISCKGPLNLQKREAELDLTMDPIGNRVLNAFFSSRKIDFQNTSLRFNAHLSLANHGQQLALSGSLDAPTVAFTSPTMPPDAWKSTSFTGDFAIEIDFSKSRALFKTFTLHGRREDKPFMEGALHQPMSLTWGDSPSADTTAQDAELSIQVLPFDTVSILPFLNLPEAWKVSRGMLETAIKITSSNQGQKLNIDTHARLAGVILDSPFIKLVDSDLSADGMFTLDRLSNLSVVNEAVLSITEKTSPLLTIHLSGSRDLYSHQGAGSLEIRSALSEVGKVLPILQTSYSSGAFQSRLTWTQKDHKTYACRINASMDNASLVYHQIPYDQLSLSFSGDLTGAAGVIQMDNATFAVTRHGAPAGTCLFKASFTDNDSALRVHYDFKEWKDPLFSPFFSLWFPERKLRSMELSSHGDWLYQDGGFSWKNEGEMKNFILEDAAPTASSPLSLKITTDVGYSTNQILQIKEMTLQWDPVEGAENLIQIRGSLQSQAQRWVGDLTMQTKSLDLTPWWDRFAPISSSNQVTPATSGGMKTPANAPNIDTAAPVASPPPPPSSGGKSWDLSLNLQADSIRIRSLQVTEVHLPYIQKGETLRLDNGSLKLNGSPISAKIWTDPPPGKPLFHFELQGDALPLAPVVDAFAPKLRNTLGGTLNLKFYGQGRGLNSGDLQNHLDAALEISAKGTHMQQVPAMKHALEQLGKLLQSDDIAASSMDQIEASARISDGKVHTDNLHLAGSAIEATLRGNLLWNQQLQMEAGLKIKRDVMNRSALLSQLTQIVSAETGDWIKLPNATRVGGSLSNPDVQVDSTKLIGGAAINTGVNILKEFLKKKEKEPSPSELPDTSTNAPPASTGPVNNLMDQLLKKKNP